MYVKFLSRLLLTAETNHTIMIPGSDSTLLSLGDQIGVFFIADNGSVICAGSSLWTGDTLQIVALGDDSTTPELDGLEEGSTFLFIAQSGNDIYSVNATFQTSAMANYAVNGISFVTGFDFELACTIDNLGCTDPSACNYNADANIDDNSCYNNDLGCGCDTPAEDGYNCDGTCLVDSDGDGVCDRLRLVGCQDQQQLIMILMQQIHHQMVSVRL